MSQESDKAYYEWLSRNKFGKNVSPLKQTWDAALDWCRPLAVAAIKKAKATPPAIRKRSPKQPKTPTEPFVVPPWIPAESWLGFEEMRVRIHAPLTARARTLTINSLLKMKEEGEDPVACLDQSVQRGWRGVFPVKPNGNGHGSDSGIPESAEAKARRQAQDAALVAKLRREAEA